MNIISQHTILFNFNSVYQSQACTIIIIIIIIYYYTHRDQI